MGINLFQKKRREANLSKTDVAIELGVPFGVYEEIEKGERKMPTKLVDSFNKITTEAKKNKNFAEADRIRGELASKGVTLLDTREGTKWSKE